MSYGKLKAMNIDREMRKGSKSGPIQNPKTFWREVDEDEIKL